MEHSPSWETNRSSNSRDIPAFYGTRRFTTAFTKARHLCLFWTRSIQSIPYPTSWRPILILRSHLRLGLSSGLFPWGLPTKTLYAPLLSPHVLHTRPPPPWFRPFTRIFSAKYRPQTSSVYCLLHSCYLVPFRPKYPPQHPILEHLSVRSSLIAGHQVSHPYKRTREIIVLYIWIFILLNRKHGDKRFCTSHASKGLITYLLSCYLVSRQSYKVELLITDTAGKFQFCPLQGVLLGVHKVTNITMKITWLL